MSLATLQKLISLNLSTEQMAGVMEVLTVELAPLEAIRRSGRERQQRLSHKTSVSPEREHDVRPKREDDASITLAPSRVEDNILNLSLVETSRKTHSPFPPCPSKPEPDGFSEFWATYPKRDGSADRKGALKAFGPAVKRASLETIINGAQHFSEAMRARGKVGTEYIPQARTWLNGDRWNERYDAAASDDTEKAHNLSILEKYSASPRS